MELSEEEVNKAMGIYLGGGEKGGYDPAGREERLRAAYGTDWKAVRKSLDPYLAVVANAAVNWAEESVHEASGRVDRMLEEHCGFFDERVRRKLVGFFVYEWK